MPAPVPRALDRACICTGVWVARRCAGAGECHGKHFQPNPFGDRAGAPACAGRPRARPRGGRGFRAGPGRVVSPAWRGPVILTPIRKPNPARGLNKNIWKQGRRPGPRQPKCQLAALLRWQICKSVQWQVLMQIQQARCHRAKLQSYRWLTCIAVQRLCGILCASV